jgi:NtrC-family two-component system sensor histidine kinase KinB
MTIRSLRTRFLLAGCLFVAATVGCGVWSAVTFANLSNVVDEVVGQSQQTIDLTAQLATTLEREDDALLRPLTGKVTRARQELRSQRRHFDALFARMVDRLPEGDQRRAAAALRRHVDAYRLEGNRLLAAARKPAALDGYHLRVNPALRLAVADCGQIRELNFRSMEAAGIRARDTARRSSGIVALIAASALGLSTFVAVRLTRTIVGPIREITRSVEAIRHDDFGQRVRVDSSDELGRLAEGVNRMAETLADYRSSSLGELLLAKMTLEATLAALPEAVIVVDPDGAIVSTNPLAREVLRANGKERAATIGDLAFPPDVMRAVHDTLAGKRAGNGRADLRQALAVSLNGRPHKMALTVAPIPEFLPRRCGAVIALDDVTDFARLDELRSELVAVASHELKTPLTVLQMNLMLLQETAENLTPRQREILAAGLVGGQELAATIDELLDMTRIEAGQLRLQREQVDLYAVIEQAVRGLGPRFEDGEIALRVVKDAPEAAVRGDAARLKLVFANLLTNALKYTPRGGEVAIRVVSGHHTVAEGKQLVQIAVTDTGPGVPAEFRERVFEKFFRVEHQQPDEREGVRGAGIGLYLCRQIVEAHGGKIWCESGEGGRGTRITLRLELADGARSAVGLPG